MSPWATFYEGRASMNYLLYARERYRPFLDAIRSRIKTGDVVLELGAGVGTITRALIGARCHFWATDLDKDQLRTMSARFSDFPEVTVSRLDATSGVPAMADVIHSHGMLEHFDDDTIRKVIDTYRRFGRTQVHYVPGLYETPSFGDERLMSVAAWWKICKPVGLSQIITFNDGLDYALVFE